jgi:hypothetical protein
VCGRKVEERRRAEEFDGQSGKTASRGGVSPAVREEVGGMEEEEVVVVVAEAMRCQILTSAPTMRGTRRVTVSERVDGGEEEE